MECTFVRMAKVNRPKDMNQLAKLIVEMATGEKENDKDVILKQREKEPRKTTIKKGRNS